VTADTYRRVTHGPAVPTTAAGKLPPNLDRQRQGSRWQANLVVAGLNPHVPSDRLAANDRVFGSDGSDSDGPLVDLKSVGANLGLITIAAGYVTRVSVRPSIDRPVGIRLIEARRVGV